MKHFKNYLNPLLLSVGLLVCMACTDGESTPEVPTPEPWAVNISRTATGGQDLLVMLDTDGAVQKGRLRPAETDGGTAAWVGDGLSWPGNGTVKLTTFCPYPADGKLPATLSSTDGIAYQMDYVETPASLKVREFTLHHLMAQLEVHIKLHDDLHHHYEPTDATVDLCTMGTLISAKKKLQADATSHQACDLGTFGCDKDDSTESDEHWVNTAQLVIPQTLPRGVGCLHFKAGIHTYTFVPETDIELTAGKKTKLILGVAYDNPKVVIMEVTVSPWQQQTINGGVATEE